MEIRQDPNEDIIDLVDELDKYEAGLLDNIVPQRMIKKFNVLDCKSFGLYDEEDCVGFIAVIRNFADDSVYIDRMFIQEKYRGKGYGTKLYDLATDGLSLITVGSIVGDSEEFYKKQGMKPYQVAMIKGK